MLRPVYNRAGGKYGPCYKTSLLYKGAGFFIMDRQIR